MLSQLINNGFFLVFREQKSSYFPAKKHVVEQIEIITVIVTQT